MEDTNEGSSIETPWDLVKILLSPRTLPHVFLLIVGTGGLFALISTLNNDPGVVAIIFTSAMASYIITAIIGNNSRINKWLLADTFSSIPAKVIGPLFVPILLTGVTAVIFLAIAEDKNVRDIWALSLASLFIFWSIGQGLALKSSIRDLIIKSKSSKNSELISPTSWDLRRLIIGAFIYTGIIGILRGGVIPNFLGGETKIISWIIYSIISPIIIAVFLQISKDGIMPLDTSWTKGDRNRVHRTGQLLIFLIAWHLSSAWSRLSGTEGNAILFEEIILVILTVVSAVWAMSNRNKSNIKLISKDSAIFWAIAFGFGYAGSITVMSGLTESLPILGDVSQTLGIGHILTAATLLIGFNSTILRPIGSNNEQE